MEDGRTLAATGDGCDGPVATASEELAPGTRLGRYLVLGKLGAGGMGVVYAAHDPELDRKVAIKLVVSHGDGAGDDAGQPRLLREAQALARLSHPNVVAVYDVGTHDRRVWIAMEFVVGRTLGTWAMEQPRSLPERLRVLTDAARGVAAAHAAGLVHRDLKPDNVMIGKDGRVWVMDFGLAHGRSVDEPQPSSTSPPDGAGAATLGLVSTLAAAMATHAGPTLAETASHTGSRAGSSALSLQLTRAGAIQGTPAYMAPEQWEGREAGPAVDQFGWSVMAWELLYGERPFTGDSMIALAAAVISGRRGPAPRRRGVPGWLRRVLERGLAVQPAQRWPTTAALLAALERGQTRARVRMTVLVIAAIAAVGLGAEAYRRWKLAHTVAGCEAAGSDIDAVWDEDARGQLRVAFLATGVGHAGATADRVIPWLDRRTQAWRQVRTDVCLHAEVDHSWDPDTVDRALWCLEDRRIAIASLVAQFVQAGPEVMQRAISAAAGLRSSEPCADAGLLQRQPAPPTVDREQIDEVRAALSRARTLAVAGKYDAGLVVATHARERAEALAWRPLVAAARYREGLLLDDTGAYAQAEDAMADAYFEATRQGAWEVASDAASSLVFTVGEKLARHADARTWARHAEVMAAHAGDPEGVREANRLNQLAAVQQSAGAYSEALALHGRVVELRTRALGEDHPDVARSLINLANAHVALGELAAARTLYERALKLLETVLGPEHPDVATSRNNLANVFYMSGANVEALALFERVLVDRERALGPRHPDVAQSLNNLAIQYESSDPAKSQRLYERALAIKEETLGPDHPTVANSLTNLAGVQNARGAHAEALALLERALAIRERALAPDHADIAETLYGLNLVYADMGRLPEALAALERAVPIYAGQEGEQDGELAARFALAKALAAAGREPARAVAEAEKVRDAYRAHGDRGAAELAELAKVEAWLNAHATGHRP